MVEIGRGSTSNEAKVQTAFSVIALPAATQCMVSKMSLGASLKGVQSASASTCISMPAPVRTSIIKLSFLKGADKEELDQRVLRANLACIEEAFVRKADCG